MWREICKALFDRMTPEQKKVLMATEEELGRIRNPRGFARNHS